MNKAKLIKAGILLYVGGAAAGYLYFQNKSKPSKELLSSPLSEKERIALFDSNSQGYNDEVGIHEKLSGIMSLREELVNSSRGLVLELGAGTGRNYSYFAKKKVKSPVVAVDYSKGMLEVAEKTAKNENFEVYSNVSNPELSIGDALRKIVSSTSPATLIVQHNVSEGLPFANGQFDTVIDTFSLCSFEDPVAVLKEARRVLKPGGKIYLLEHGAGEYKWLNRLLDKNASGHVHKYGCYWNRDILGIVKDAGLQIVDSKRKHGGTTYFIVAE